MSWSKLDAQNTTNRRHSLPLPSLFSLFRVQVGLLAGLVLFASSPAFTLGWQEGLEGIQIEKKRVSGELHGAFELEKAELKGGILTLRQGEDFFADRELQIFLFLEEGESIEKKKYRVAPSDGMQQAPHVHMSYKVAGQDLPETEMFMSDYTMKLQFTTIKNGKVNGRIYLALPDDERSWVSGYFKATLAEEAGTMTTTEMIDSDSAGNDDNNNDIQSAVLMGDVDDGSTSSLDESSFGMAMETEMADMEVGSASLPLLAMILIGLGSLLGLVGGIWLVVKGFQEHWLWGLACFTPIALVFFVMHFKKSLKPVMVSVLGMVFTVGGWASALFQIGM